MTKQHIIDQIQDLVLKVGQRVYDDLEQIQGEVEIRMSEDGLHPGDDVDAIYDYTRDVLKEIAQEEMEK